MRTNTDMASGITDDAIYTLQAWLSPSYPVGAYTFSHGLEFAVEAGWTASAGDVETWLRDVVRIGNGFADQVFLVAAWTNYDEPEALGDIISHCFAFQSTKELRLESTAQGAAFLRVTREVWPAAALEALVSSDRLTYPVAVGVAAAAHGVALNPAMACYGHALVSNLVSAAVRLVPLGQTDGQRILASLQADVIEAASRARATPIEELGTATVGVDIASMNHETQYTRLFRS